MNSAVWKWLVGLFYFSPGSLWLADAARTLVALKTAVDPGSTHCSSRISISAQLHICSELPLAWEAKAPQHSRYLFTSCHVLWLRSLDYLGPSPPLAFSWRRSPEPGHCLGQEIWIMNHTLQEQKAFLFFCVLLWHFFGGGQANVTFETDTRSCGILPTWSDVRVLTQHKVLTLPMKLRSLTCSSLCLTDSDS